MGVGDGTVRIHGLEQAMAGELLEFEDGTIGIALNLEEDNVGAVLMGTGLDIQEGSTVKATGKIAQVPVGEAMVGRVVDSLGRPIDGKGDIKASEYRLIESTAPGIIARKSVCEPLQTGITAIAIDTIINQKSEDVICVYVAIGQKASTVAQVIGVLEEKGAMDYTIVVAANANDPATLQYL